MPYYPPPSTGGGTVTTTGSPSSGNLTKFSGATSITNGDLSGDVTTSGTPAATIANDAVTYAKIQNVTTNKLLGRATAGSGDTEEITLGTNLSYTGTTLNAAGAGAGMTIHGDSNYTILSTDRTVVTNAVFTAPRTWTLPAATAVAAGVPITVADLGKGVGAANTLTIAAPGSDRIYPPNVANYILSSVGAGVTLISDGTSKWFIEVVQPGASVNTGQYMQCVSSVWGLSGYTLPVTVGTTGKIAQSDGTNIAMSTPTWPAASGAAGYKVRSDGTNFLSYPTQLINSSTASQSATFAADTYLTGSNTVVAAGDFKAKGQYRCVFDMVKTGAGTAAMTIDVRIGVNGTTADTSQIQFVFGAGTGVIDTGIFEVIVNWRTVGGGTSAVVSGICRAEHNLATTGLFNNAAAWTIVGTVSGGFNSSTATNIGLSVNGGASFSGTVTTVQAVLEQ